MCIILSSGASDCGQALRLNSSAPLIKVRHLGSASKRAGPTELNIDAASMNYEWDPIPNVKMRSQNLKRDFFSSSFFLPRESDDKSGELSPP